MVTACSPCNHRKANRTPEQARMPLSHAPGEPNHVHLIWAVRRVTDVQARWIAMFYGEDALEVLKGEDAGEATPGNVTPGHISMGTAAMGKAGMGSLPDWSQSSIQAYGFSQS